MVAYNFKEQFANLVASGEKCQTIRAIGKRRHVKSGETIQLYSGLRTKQCRKLGDAVCVSAQDIEMDIQQRPYTVDFSDGKRLYLAQIVRFHIAGGTELIVGDKPANFPAANELLADVAQADGFRPSGKLTAAELMATWFLGEHGSSSMEFKGKLIKWGELQ